MNTRTETNPQFGWPADITLLRAVAMSEYRLLSAALLIALLGGAFVVLRALAAVTAFQ